VIRGAWQLADVVARLRAAGLLLREPAVDAPLSGIADDNRYVGPGDLFCAWVGTRHDGHDFLPQAMERGAAAALVERQVAPCPLPQVVVQDGRRAAALAAALLMGSPEERLKLAGVTGTNGKTTTVWILRHLLGAALPTASLGTLGIVPPDGVILEGGETLTTPGPVELPKLLARLEEAGAAAVALEISSHALEQGRVEALRLDAAVFTNLTRDHLDYHGSLAAYRAAKRRLAALLRPAGTAVVNALDPAWAGVEAEVRHCVRFAVVDGEAPVPGGVELVGRVLARTPLGTRFRLELPGASAGREVLLPLLGAYNVENAVAAAGAALALGVAADDVARGLEVVPQVPGRLELVAAEPCPVLTDYAHTPDALANVLATLRQVVTGRVMVVFGAGGDRDRGKRPLMGRAAEAGADVVVVTSDNPRTEDPDAIIDDIVAGMERAPLREPDRQRAIAAALALAAPGDVVLLAGKGHETYQVLGTEKVDFDERKVVAALLRSESGRRAG
jgi:UDP-N-acetylmuramoyl-L-alanyl-D-glutamate--2,6-diaminopimelate ligase